MSTPATETSTAEIARAYFDAVASRDVEAMMRLWRPGGMGHLHGMVSLRAPEGYREWFGNLFEAFPDLRMEVLDLVAEGEKAAVRWRAAGTFSGPVQFEGLDATHGSIEMEGLDMLTVKDGEIVENRAYTNATELARQLGAMPAQGSWQERGMIAGVNLRTRIARLLGRG